MATMLVQVWLYSYVRYVSSDKSCIVAFFFCFYSIIDLRVLLVVVPFGMVVFDDVGTKDAEEVAEGWTLSIEFKERN